MTDPSEFPAPDDTGTATITRYAFQASVALRFVLQMIGGSDVLHVTCEHFEDVVVARTPTTASDPDLPHWEFMQVKSRESNEPWTMREISRSGALKSLLRTDRELRRHVAEGMPIDYRLTAVVEGGLQPDEVDARGHFARAGNAESNDVIWLARQLGTDEVEIVDFLSRVHVARMPRRDLLERDNKDALQSLSSRLTVGEVRELHEELSGMVWRAMRAQLAPDWQRLIIETSPAGTVLRKRLTPAKIAHVRLRLQQDELFDFLEASSRADETHPYFFAASAPAPRLADVHVPLQITDNEGKAVTLVDAARENKISVIIAGPGSGKTSLLHTLQADCSRGWIAGDEQPSLAVVVPAASLVGRPFSPAIAHAANEFLSDLGLRRTLSDDLFSKPPQDGKRWLVLVDGIDEIADAHRRQNLIRALADLTAQSHRPVYQLVIATRPIPDVELAMLGSASVYRLQPLSNADLTIVIAHWLGHLGILDPTKAAQELMRTFAEAGMNEIARVPLMAALLCQVYAADPQRSIPRGRNELYSRFTDMVAARMNGRGEAGIRWQTETTLIRFGSEAKNRAEAFLDELYELIDQLAAEDTTAPKDPRSYFAPAGEWVDPRDHSISTWTRRIAALPAAARPRAVPAEDWDGFLASVLRRCGLLVSTGGNLDFIHQTLQEFCAARYAKRTVDTHVAELRRILEPWNRDVYSNPWGAPLDLVSYIAFLADSENPEARRLALDNFASIASSENLKACLLVSLLAPLGALTGDLGLELVRQTTASLILAIEEPVEGDDATTRVWAATILVALDKQLGTEALARLSCDPSLDEQFNEDPHNPDFSERLAATTSLLSFDFRRGSDALVDLVDDGENLDDTVRVRAAEILLRIGDDRAMAALESLGRDEDILYPERELAIAILGGADRTRGADALYALISEHLGSKDWGDYGQESIKLLSDWGDARGARLINESGPSETQ